MASEVLNLTAQIVSSHAAMTELTPKELVRRLKKCTGSWRLLKLDCPLEAVIPVRAGAGNHEPSKCRNPPRPRRLKMGSRPVGDPDYMEFMESGRGEAGLGEAGYGTFPLRFQVQLGNE